MAYDDMREFLAALEQQGLLRRVRKEVDPEWEIGCLVKWAFQSLPEDQRFGLMFESVKGSGIPLATGAIGASVRAYAMALGVEPAQINAKWDEALSNPQAPRIVQDPLCQQVISDPVDLANLPIPIWTPGKDAGLDREKYFSKFRLLS